MSVQTEDTLLLRAPKDSHNMKSAERGIVQSMHKFNFTKVNQLPERKQNMLSLNASLHGAALIKKAKTSFVPHLLYFSLIFECIQLLSELNIM